MTNIEWLRHVQWSVVFFFFFLVFFASSCASISTHLPIFIFVWVCVFYIILFFVVTNVVFAMIIIDEPMYECVCVSINNNCILRHTCAHALIFLFFFSSFFDHWFSVYILAALSSSMRACACVFYRSRRTDGHIYTPHDRDEEEEEKKNRWRNHTLWIERWVFSSSDSWDTSSIDWYQVKQQLWEFIQVVTWLPFSSSSFDAFFLSDFEPSRSTPRACRRSFTNSIYISKERTEEERLSDLSIFRCKFEFRYCWTLRNLSLIHIWRCRRRG